MPTGQRWQMSAIAVKPAADRIKPVEQRALTAILVVLRQLEARLPVAALLAQLGAFSRPVVRLLAHSAQQVRDNTKAVVRLVLIAQLDVVQALVALQHLSAPVARLGSSSRTVGSPAAPSAQLGASLSEVPPNPRARRAIQGDPPATHLRLALTVLLGSSTPAAEERAWLALLAGSRHHQEQAPARTVRLGDDGLAPLLAKTATTAATSQVLQPPCV